MIGLRRRRFTVRLGVCALMAVPTLATAQGSTELFYAESGRRALMNPHANAVASAPTDRLLSMIYEPLYRLNLDTEQFESVLAARSPQPVAGARVPTYLVDLKKGVRWHDGSAFTAADVVFTHRYIMRYGKNKEDQAALARWIKRLDQDPKKPYQLRVEVEPGVQVQWALSFLVIPSGRFAADMQPLSPSLLEKPVGTGPYKWDGEEGGEPRLVINTTHHDPTKGVLTPIVSKEYTDAPTVAVELINQGSRLGLIPDLPTSQFGTIEANANLVEMERLASYKIHALAIRQQPGVASPMNNQKVREALVLAIDRAKMLKTRFSDRGKLMTTPYSPNTVYADASFEGLPYDPERARKLIAEAGAKGSRLRLLARRTTSINKQRDDDVLEDIRQQLLAVGFNVVVSQVSPDEYDRLKYGDGNTWDVALVTQEFDPNHDISWLYHSRSSINGGANYMRFRNTEVDALFNRAEQETDDAARSEYLRRVGVLLGRLVPAVFLVNEEPVYAYKRKFEIDKSDVHQFNFFTYANRWRTKARR